MAETVERAEPRISINKLGEYMAAKPARRRRIIADQKRPRGFIVTRYREAVSAMIDFLVRGAADDAIIYRAIAELEAKEVSSDFQAQDRDLSVEALELFLDTVDRLDLNGLEVSQANHNAAPLAISGVSVSVRPEAVLNGQDRHGGRTVGCLKLYLSKTSPFGEDGVAAGYIGAALHRFTEEQLANGGRADYRLCQVVDVFGRRVFVAPRAMQRRHDDLEAACEEIALLWNAVLTRKGPRP